MWNSHHTEGVNWHVKNKEVHCLQQGWARLVEMTESEKFK